MREQVDTECATEGSVRSNVDVIRSSKVKVIRSRSKGQNYTHGPIGTNDPISTNLGMCSHVDTEWATKGSTVKVKCQI
jgi:hypothetical protein